MPSKHMLAKGKRRGSVRAAYRAARDSESATAAEGNAGAPEEPVVADSAVRDSDSEVRGGETARRTLEAPQAAAGTRLDAWLAQEIEEISRSRVQMMIEAGQVRVDGAAAKAKYKLKGGEQIELEGEPRPEPLHATAEDIPLEILYEDEYLAVVNKPAGMKVHAGAGASEQERSGGTLVNALLHYLSLTELSAAGGDLRPGIVHRLDKETSGAIVIAKDDVTHRKLGEMFAGREISKTYIALVHGRLEKNDVTVDLPIARDLVRRTRMTTRRADGRRAVSHVHVLERLETRYGWFTLVEVRIETGRTHQIRVHMQALGHPVVGDTLYGAPRVLSLRVANPRLTDHVPDPTDRVAALSRNFLHAARLGFPHPRTGKAVAVEAPLPNELQMFLSWLRSGGS